MIIYTILNALGFTRISLETNHRYLVPGHTFLPFDSDLGFTERKSGKTGVA